MDRRSAKMQKQIRYAAYHNENDQRPRRDEGEQGKLQRLDEPDGGPAMAANSSGICAVARGK